MVDLHQSLRPTGAVTPPPVAEIAARAARRRRRRLTVVSGTMAIVAAIGLAVATDALSRSTPTATVADGVIVDPATTGDGTAEPSPPPPSSTTRTTSPPSPSASDGQPRASGAEVPPSSPEDESPATSLATTMTSDAAADDAAPAGPELLASPGLRATATITSSWASGYCLQIDVDNVSAERVTWEVVAGLGGRVDEHWNSTVETAGDDTVFTGTDGYNVVLDAGASTSFGACVDTAGQGRDRTPVTDGSAGSADR